MTDLTMTDLAIIVWKFVGEEPRTEKEIEEMLLGKNTDDSVAHGFTQWAAGKGYIRISPGSEKVAHWIQGKNPEEMIQ